MSTSQRTFEQVKNILGKLDRDIDAARAKRLQTRPAPPAAAVAVASAGVVGGVVGGSPPILPIRSTPTSNPITSPFGRATPMRMDQRTQANH